jgi:hypothetical protein
MQSVPFIRTHELLQEVLGRNKTTLVTTNKTGGAGKEVPQKLPSNCPVLSSTVPGTLLPLACLCRVYFTGVVKMDRTVVCKEACHGTVDLLHC